MKLHSSYYLHQDVVALSRDLLGKFLVTHINGINTAGMIVETEAYHGEIDKASHAYNHRRTQRTEVMYKKGGILYVYLCYGIHYLTNIVVNEAEIPHAILIRAIEPADGVNEMLRRLNKQNIARCTAGPALVSKALGIDKSLNAASLSGKVVFIEDRGVRFSNKQIVAATRIGVEYAGAHAKWKYRFYCKNNPYVSRY